MIDIVNKEDCCGCSACAGACPKNCITIKQDSEGFYYPETNTIDCINCGICNKKCPILNAKPEHPFKQTGYVVQNKNLDVLKESTSGGAFTAFAEYIIENGGVVVGATLSKDMRVEHILVDEKKDLCLFRNSKYVQSYISPELLKEVTRLIKQGRLVCFSGTSCQIEGLRQLLSTVDCSSLYCIDVVCRAVPSPLAFRKYTEYLAKRYNSKIKNIRFRDKSMGYTFPTVKAIFEKKQNSYHRGIESDPWLRAFFTGICNRPSCHNCKFKKRYRLSDITIWDCFNYGEWNKELIPNKGATNVLLHTEKGEQLFSKITNRLTYTQVDIDEQFSNIKEMTQCVPSHLKRANFFKDANRMDGYELFSKYFPVGIKQSILYAGRWCAAKTGVYSMLDNIVRKLKQRHVRS